LPTKRFFILFLLSGPQLLYKMTRRYPVEFVPDAYAE
jgi:hypothetical protein